MVPALVFVCLCVLIVHRMVLQVQGTVVEEGACKLASQTQSEQLKGTSSICMMRLVDMNLGEGDDHDGARIISHEQAALLVEMNMPTLLQYTWVSAVCMQVPC